mmetsp:Transcript_8854/g.13703  ORF Transcript_8854/g.13703 Transcript_8854/m.13703 type:complete len:239 (-) Transcript_8854:1502-2218(-)
MKRTKVASSPYKKLVHQAEVHFLNVVIGTTLCHEVMMSKKLKHQTDGQLKNRHLNFPRNIDAVSLERLPIQRTDELILLETLHWSIELLTKMWFMDPATLMLVDTVDTHSNNPNRFLVTHNAFVITVNLQLVLIFWPGLHPKINSMTKPKTENHLQIPSSNNSTTSTRLHIQQWITTGDTLLLTTRPILHLMVHCHTFLFIHIPCHIRDLLGASLQATHNIQPKRKVNQHFLLHRTGY